MLIYTALHYAASCFHDLNRLSQGCLELFTNYLIKNKDSCIQIPIVMIQVMSLVSVTPVKNESPKFQAIYTRTM